MPPGAMKATEAVMSGEVNSAFALVRPPGHHATRDEAMGFRLFNNIAIAAKYALNSFPVKRIAIIDFDVHHGNGTQEAFEVNRTYFTFPPTNLRFIRGAAGE